MNKEIIIPPITFHCRFESGLCGHFHTTMDSVILVHSEETLTVSVLQAIFKCSVFQNNPSLAAAPHWIQSAFSLSLSLDFPGDRTARKKKKKMLMLLQNHSQITVPFTTNSNVFSHLCTSHSRKPTPELSFLWSLRSIKTRRKLHCKFRKTELFGQPPKLCEICVRNGNCISFQFFDKLPENRERNWGLNPVESTQKSSLLLKEAAFVDRLESCGMKWSSNRLSNRVAGLWEFDFHWRERRRIGFHWWKGSHHSKRNRLLIKAADSCH
jgi:hypothetical protein